MILQKIQSFIKTANLFQSTDRLLLAISGGVDSVVLLYLLKELGYEIGLVHCNFQLRGEASDKDEAFIKELGAQHDLPVYIQRFETAEVAKKQRQSIQMVARDQRYAYFETIRSEQDYDYIITAHHIDDRIETFLLNFLRGTGLAGLKSIPAKNGFIRRPLLGLNRWEIIVHQKANKIVFREDESNASDKYRRNFLRHHVLPKLYELEPQLSEIAQKNFQHFDQMDVLYKERIEELKTEMITKEGNQTVLDLKAVQSHPAKESLLWSFLKDYDFTPEQQRQFLAAKKGTLIQTEYFQALIGEGKLFIENRLIEISTVYWEKGHSSIKLESGKELSISMHSKISNFKTGSSEILLDANLLHFPLKIKMWQSGDHFHPFGMEGKSQKLKDFFINNKINRLDRNKVPILVNGNDEIIWIVGYRMDERYRVDAGTEIIGRVCYLK